MRRSLTLFREILVALAKCDHPADFNLHYRHDRTGRFRDCHLFHHCWLLADAGLIGMDEFQPSRTWKVPQSRPSYLTARGQWLATLCLPQSRWDRAIGLVGKHAETIPLRLMGELLEELARQEIDGWLGNGSGGASPK